jgi:hypothetical protein
LIDREQAHAIHSRIARDIIRKGYDAARMLDSALNNQPAQEARKAGATTRCGDSTIDRRDGCDDREGDREIDDVADLVGDAASNQSPTGVSEIPLFGADPLQNPDSGNLGADMEYCFAKKAAGTGGRDGYTEIGGLLQDGRAPRAKFYRRIDAANLIRGG